MKRSFKDKEILAAIMGQLFDVVPESLVVINSKGKILAVNKSFLRLTDKDPKEMIGRSLLITREMQGPVLRKKFGKLLSAGQPFFEHIFKHYSEQQDRSYVMELSAVPIKTAEGKVWGAISIARDVTDLEQAQKGLRDAHKVLHKRFVATSTKLTSAEKELKKLLHSRNQFFADASHELRTPLTIIKGNLDLIKLTGQHKKIPKGARTSFLNLEQAADRMSQLLSDITFLNQSDNVDKGLKEYFEPVDLSGLLKEKAAKFKSLAAQKKVKFIVNLNRATVSGNAHRLRQLFSNLISNAMRYTKPGGNVNLVLFKSGNWAVCRVGDTGIGIAKEHLPHLFERFYRVDKERSRSVGGSGLGLAISKEIVKGHKGKISVKSRLGKGTVFTVKLPL